MSDSIGELEQKLLKIKSTHNIKVPGVTEEIVIVSTLKPEVVNAILDEARADAPDWLKAILTNARSPEEAGAMLAVIEPKDTSELFQWFFKWLGAP